MFLIRFPSFLLSVHVRIPFYILLLCLSVHADALASATSLISTSTDLSQTSHHTSHQLPHPSGVLHEVGEEVTCWWTERWRGARSLLWMLNPGWFNKSGIHLLSTDKDFENCSICKTGLNLKCVYRTAQQGCFSISSRGQFKVEGSQGPQPCCQQSVLSLHSTLLLHSFLNPLMMCWVPTECIFWIMQVIYDRTTIVEVGTECVGTRLKCSSKPLLAPFVSFYPLPYLLFLFTPDCLF